MGYAKQMAAGVLAMFLHTHAHAYGAVAVGQPGTPKDGVAVGASWNAVSEDAARVFALQQCLDSQVSPMKARAACQVVHTFSRGCVSIVADQSPGGTGWGWAVEPQLNAAERKAQELCKARTCVATVAACDTVP